MEDNTLNDKDQHGLHADRDGVHDGWLFDQAWKEERTQSMLDPDKGAPTGEKEAIWNKIAARGDAGFTPAPRKGRLGWVAIAAAWLVVSAVAIQVYRQVKAPGAAKVSTGDLTVVTGKNYVKLPDGSTVELNDGSTLSYSPDFGAKDRIVYLDGQGYFDVAHNSAKPFQVRSGNVVTTVLGTAFDVRAYFNQGDVTITVARGKVVVGNTADEKFGELLPNQQMTYHKESSKTETRQLIAEQELAWKADFLILDGVTVEEAVKKIADRFNSRMAFHDSAVLACKINVAFVHGEDLEQMMTVMEGVTSAHYEFHNNVITVTGGNPCD